MSDRLVKDAPTEPDTLAAVGKRLSLTGERVRQLEQALLTSLRNAASKELAA